jgi:hypothetical protein
MSTAAARSPHRWLGLSVGGKAEAPEPSGWDGTPDLRTDSSPWCARTRTLRTLGFKHTARKRAPLNGRCLGL